MPLQGSLIKQNEREGTVGAAHPCRGRAASHCKAPEGTAAFAVPLSCPGTRGSSPALPARTWHRSIPAPADLQGWKRNCLPHQHGNCTLPRDGWTEDTYKPHSRTLNTPRCLPQVHVHTALIFTLRFLPIPLRLLGAF